MLGRTQGDERGLGGRERAEVEDGGHDEAVSLAENCVCSWTVGTSVFCASSSYIYGTLSESL